MNQWMDFTKVRVSFRCLKRVLKPKEKGKKKKKRKGKKGEKRGVKRREGGCEKVDEERFWREIFIIKCLFCFCFWFWFWFGDDSCVGHCCNVRSLCRSWCCGGVVFHWFVTFLSDSLSLSLSLPPSPSLSLFFPPLCQGKKWGCKKLFPLLSLSLSRFSLFSSLLMNFKIIIIN